MAEKNLKSPIDWYIVNQVRDLRQAHGVTQEMLSIQLGYSHGFIGQIESPRCRAKYNIMHLNEIARIFKCSPKYFMPEESLPQ